MELHFFALSKRYGLNRTILLEVPDGSGPGSWYVSTTNMAAELPVALDVLADDLENDFFGEDGDDFIFLVAATSILAICIFNRILGYFKQTIVTLPIRKDIHCMEESCINLPLSFKNRLFEGCITVSTG